MRILGLHTNAVELRSFAAGSILLDPNAAAVPDQRAAGLTYGFGALLLANSSIAATDTTYGGEDKLTTITGPANLNGERYSPTYTYDTTVNIYLESVADKLPCPVFYTSCAYPVREILIYGPALLILWSDHVRTI